MSGYTDLFRIEYLEDAVKRILFRSRGLLLRSGSRRSYRSGRGGSLLSSAGEQPLRRSLIHRGTHRSERRSALLGSTGGGGKSAVVKAGGDNGDSDLIVHVLIKGRTEDDICIGVRCLLNEVCCGLYVLEIHVL